jgi:hypothetical protein
MRSPMVSPLKCFSFEREDATHVALACHAHRVRARELEVRSLDQQRDGSAQLRRPHRLSDKLRPLFQVHDWRGGAQVDHRRPRLLVGHGGANPVHDRACGVQRQKATDGDQQHKIIGPRPHAKAG